MRKSIVLTLGSLCVLSLALSACESDSGGTDNSGTGGDSDAGTGTGGDNNNVGTGGNNNPGTGGNGNPGTGGNGNPGTGGNGNPGTGGNGNPGTGGNDQGGRGARGGQSVGGQAGAPSEQCQPSAQCTGNSTCNGTCQTQGGRPGARACVCMNGMLFCGQCQVQQPMGSVCPDAPQGKDCPDNTQQCSYGSGDGAGVCACLADRLVCPSLPAPAGSDACPANPNFMTCQDEGDYCTRSNNRFCYCAAVGGGMPRWICQN